MPARDRSLRVAAGQPPELNNANRTYWYGQGEMADLKDLVTKFKDKAGGMYEIGISSRRYVARQASAT